MRVRVGKGVRHVVVGRKEWVWVTSESSSSCSIACEHHECCDLIASIPTYVSVATWKVSDQPAWALLVLKRRCSL